MEQLRYRAGGAEIPLTDIGQALDLIEKGGIPPHAEIFYPMCNMWMTTQEFRKEIFPFESRSSGLSGSGWIMIVIAGVVCLVSIYFMVAGGLAFFAYLVALPGLALIFLILVIFGALGVLINAIMSATDR